MDENLDENRNGVTSEPLMPLSMPSAEHHDELIKGLVSNSTPTDTEPLMPLSMPHVASSGPQPSSETSGSGGTPPPFDYANWTPSAEGPGGGRGTGQRRKIVGLVAIVALIAGGVGAAVGAITNSNNNGPTTPGVQSLPPTPASSSNTNSNIVTSVAAEVTPAVVDIVTTIATQTGQTTQQAAGTGMIVTPSGEVLTNNHVVAEATTIKVSIQGHTGLYNARVIGVDPPQTSDVALLQIEGITNLPYVHLGDSSQVKVGQPVVAIGNALGMGGSPSVVNGIVSSLNRTITASDSTGAASEVLHGLIQTDAPIVPGDSGGPLVNAQGQVIGMDTAALSSQSGTNATIGFALPINTVRTIVTNIEQGVAKNGILLGESPYLGVFEQVSSGLGGTGGFVFGNGNGNGNGNSGNTGNTGTAAPTVPGVLLGGVATGSPADQVGLVAGDVITSINGQKTPTWTALVAIVQRFHPGATLTVSFADSTGVPHTVTLKLAGIPK